jgi:hypothetical protein
MRFITLGEYFNAPEVISRIRNKYGVQNPTSDKPTKSPKDSHVWNENEEKSWSSWDSLALLILVLLLGAFLAYVRS